MTSGSLALALSAGGARGAYQAGAMRFFAEQGIKFSAVAGTSIGALNGAYYAQGDGSVAHIDGLVQLWRSLPDMHFLQITEATAVAALKLFTAMETATIVSTAASLALGDFSLFDPKPIANILDNHLDYKKICDSPVKFTIATLPEMAPLFDMITGRWRSATYHNAHELASETLRQVLLASTAIPLAFPSQDIQGGKHADASLTDPLPAQVFRDGHTRIIFSLFLSDDIVQNRADFPDQVLFQVRPSLRLKTGPFSMFDFSRQTINQLIALGYQDAEADFREAATIVHQVFKNQKTIQNIEQKVRNLPKRVEPH
jgi:NTE family protein